MSLFNFLGGRQESAVVNGEFTREKLQAQSGKIRLSDNDSEAQLDLFCYNRCSNEEADLVKNCRGVVFNGEKVIMRGFPYTEEYTTDESSYRQFSETVGDDVTKYRYFDAHEGALLRVFYWQDKWYISTHRKLDAFRSKWASKESFGQMFKNALEVLWKKQDPAFLKQLSDVDDVDYVVAHEASQQDASQHEDKKTEAVSKSTAAKDVSIVTSGTRTVSTGSSTDGSADGQHAGGLTEDGAGDRESKEMPDVLKQFLGSLDKGKQYMFLILNNYDNRIVCVSPDEPTVYHVGTFLTTVDKDGVAIPDTMVHINEPEHNVGIEWPREHKITSFSDLRSIVAKQNSENLQGVIAYSSDTTRQFKIFNEEYYNLFTVRGNEPSVKYRYLQIRMDKGMVDKLYYLYPKYADAFDDYENSLYECAKKINKNYIDRFIKKKYVTVPKEEFTIMKACHDWHLEDREKNRISLRKVIDTMNSQNSSNLNRIIRRFKTELVKDELSRHGRMTRLRARSYSHHSEEPNAQHN